MGEFEAYFKLGLNHIADSQALDHIVFIIALCAVYSLQQWKKVAVLVTAFTIGHSITLALAALKIINISTDFVEFLIPITILITVLYNIFSRETERAKQLMSGKYGLALFFGLIHGLGFSNYFGMLMGKEESIVKPLFAFNVGIEVGQLCIMLFILLASFLFLNVLKFKQREWNLFISGAAGGISIILLMQTTLWQELLS